MKVNKALNFNGVVIYRNKIQNPAELIDALENAQQFSTVRKWQRAQVIDYKGQAGNDNSRTNEGFFLPHSNTQTSDAVESAFVELSKIFAGHFDECLQDFLSRFSASVETKTEAIGFHCLKYSLGQEFIPHMDDSPKVPRRVSALAYLNEDYEGGELWFPKLNFRYYPAAGDLVVFPSGIPYEHGAMPVISGTKYCVVGWWV